MIKTRGVKMEKIKTIWFDADRIYMKTQEGKVYSRPLEAYPDLKDASPEQRSDYVIGDDGRTSGGKAWMLTCTSVVFMKSLNRKIMR